MHQLLNLLSRGYELIIIDSPPVLVVSDALVLAQLVDKTVYVVRWAETQREAVAHGIRQFSGASLAGVALSQYTGILIFDSIASILIGLILIGTAIWLAYETKSLLIGESANEATIKGVRDILEATDSIDHVNEVLTMHMGPEYILVNLSVEFIDSATTDEIEDIIAAIDRTLKGRFSRVKRVFVEAESRSSRV